jgi:hypothetical protein
MIFMIFPEPLRELILEIPSERLERRELECE